MDRGLLLICGLTFVIHLIGTLAYSVRIAGARTRRIALTLSLFNVLTLVSRTSNSFQAPLLAKRVERNLAGGAASGIDDFRWLLLFATAATVVGALLVPTVQRALSHWVARLGEGRPLRALLAEWRASLVLPHWHNVTRWRVGPHIPWSVVALNTIAMAIWSVGALAALYAAYLRPDLRVTASQMSAVVNGIATILMFAVIDPYLSLMTDKVASGQVDESYFRRAVVWLTGSRLAGTVLAQFLLAPAALWIVTVAAWL